jgi:hypothetical protein
VTVFYMNLGLYPLTLFLSISMVSTFTKSAS